jgi:hypothetical protein
MDRLGGAIDILKILGVDAGKEMPTKLPLEFSRRRAKTIVCL